MSTRTDAIFPGHMNTRMARGPVVEIRVNGDEFLARFRSARSAIGRALAMTQKILLMWYL